MDFVTGCVTQRATFFRYSDGRGGRRPAGRLLAGAAAAAAGHGGLAGDPAAAAASRSRRHCRDFGGSTRRL